MHPLPVEGWVDDRIIYRNLIGSVVAYVRDHGPVPVEQVQYFLTPKATADLRHASPTNDVHDAALRVVNLMCDDIDVIDREGEKVFVPSDVLTATSKRFGPYLVPSAEDGEAAKEASRRRIALNDWVNRRLFATEWRNGIRDHKKPDIDWMVRQIEQFGYVGPPIVRDAETGGIIDGGLRAAALAQLGRSWNDYSVGMEFENDRHRLAYVLAAHTLPGGQTRLPRSLRDAILREVLPRSLRPGNGVPREPTDAEWLDMVGNDFNYVSLTNSVESEPAGDTVRVARSTRPRDARKKSVSVERVLEVLASGELSEADFLAALGGPTIPPILGRMMAKGGAVQKIKEGGVIKYRLTTTLNPVSLSEPLTKTIDRGAHRLICAAKSGEGRLSTTELERSIRDSAKDRRMASYELHTKPNNVWYLDGQGWRMLSEKRDGERWWWAERVERA